MAKITFIPPVDNIIGKVLSSNSNGYTLVNRKRYIGTDINGAPLYDGVSTYHYAHHQGEWSPGAIANRQLFRQAQSLARTELKNPERLAYWKEQLRSYMENLQPGQRPYYRLLGFVSSRIHAQLKENPS